MPRGKWHDVNKAMTKIFSLENTPDNCKKLQEAVYIPEQYRDGKLGTGFLKAAKKRNYNFDIS